MSIDQRLLKIKEKLDNAKVQQARAEGALQQLRQQLKTDFGLSDEKAAEKYLANLNNTCNELEKELQQMVEDMEEKYGL